MSLTMSSKWTKYIKITTTSGHIITFIAMNEEELQAMQQAMLDMQDEF